MQWATYLAAGTGTDMGVGIAVDAFNNVFILRKATIPGATYQAYSGLNDAFVAKLNSSGTLQWNTFLGGTGADDSQKVRLDSAVISLFQEQVM